MAALLDCDPHCFPIGAMSPESVILQIFDHLDERRYGALLSLMTPDAVWVRQGIHLRGHAQIRAALEERSPTQRIRHLITNLLQRAGDGQHAEFSHYMTALRHDDGEVHRGPVRIAGAFRMSVVNTMLVCTGGTWQIAAQTIAAEFEFAQAA